jgi:hypothetical protein
MVRVKLVIFCFALMFPALEIGSAETQSDEGLHFWIYLVDGSRFLCIPNAASIHLKTSFADLDISLAEIQRIEFLDSDKAVLILRSGDRLSGSLKSDSFKVQAVFGTTQIARQHIRFMDASGVRISANSHVIDRFLPETLERFIIPDRNLWRAEDGVAIGHAPDRGTPAVLTYNVAFRRIAKAIVTGRILPPKNQNFRLTVSPIHMIFNWELADENHFYSPNGTKTRTTGHALTPGVDHRIAVVQEGQEAAVYVDEKEVYRTTAQLSGIVSIFPAEGSTIAVSKLEIQGEPDFQKEVIGDQKFRDRMK